jgi:RHS repeat-associated protein
LPNAQGVVFDRYTYSPYGLPAANGRLNPSHRLNDGNTFGFGGQDHDPVFGMVYLRARYYTPAIGRFTAPDPLMMAGFDLPTLSPYVYGRNDPLRFGDPSGLMGQTNTSVYIPGRTDVPRDMAL